MSDLGKLRARMGRALGQVGRYEREIAEMREQYRAEGDAERINTARRGQHLRMVLADARHDLAEAEAALQAEEKRLLQPGQFLRFT